jgi:hypothetical protein
MLKTVIYHPENGRTAEVTNQNALKVTIVEPDIVTTGETSRRRKLADYLRNSSNSFDANVNGSVTVQEFKISASVDYEIYISSLSIVIIDSSMTMNKFGGITALTNGVTLYVEEQGEKTYVFENIKTSGALGIETKQPATNFYLMNNWSGVSDAHVFFIDLTLDNPPYGLKLGIGTNDKCVLEVRDNLTGLDGMFVKVFGSRLYSG